MACRTQMQWVFFCAILGNVSGKGKDPQVEIANCVFTTISAASYLARFGNSIQTAVLDCGTPRDERSDKEELRCAVSVLMIVEDFLSAASYLEYASAGCNIGWPNLPLYCATDITTVASDVVGISRYVSASLLDCDPNLISAIKPGASPTAPDAEALAKEEKKKKNQKSNLSGELCSLQYYGCKQYR